MMNVLRRFILSFAGCVAVIALAPTVHAGCGDGLPNQDLRRRPQADEKTGPFQEISFKAPTIVGLWNEKFHSGGKLFDFGYSVWHSDGTEILNSGGRAPSTQNFCLGVWKQTGSLSYTLTHPTFSYDATTGKMNARVTIHEKVSLSADGNSFSGPFEIDVYDPSNGTTLLQKVTGNITATRIVPD
jgi:hypothetical protein